MKPPHIKSNESDPSLSGGEGSSSWVRGYNCIYHSENASESYRVSIKSNAEWKLYGFFNDLETAAYVANIAILVEACEQTYELNKVGNKNYTELNSWRLKNNNREKENIARNRFLELQNELKILLAEEEAFKYEIKKDLEKSALKVKAIIRDSETKRLNQEKAKHEEEQLIKTSPTFLLLKMLQGDISGDQHRKIIEELSKRNDSKKQT